MGPSPTNLVLALRRKVASHMNPVIATVGSARRLPLRKDYVELVPVEEKLQDWIVVPRLGDEMDTITTTTASIISEAPAECGTSSVPSLASERSMPDVRFGESGVAFNGTITTGCFLNQDDSQLQDGSVTEDLELMDASNVSVSQAGFLFTGGNDVSAALRNFEASFPPNYQN